ncbi:hypothetical protein [Rubritalea tangerina]|uniref:hypothetical protein n=1 Tax=Rubritalea tangerina TaxID=430798 RepID=UPI00361FF385
MAQISCTAIAPSPSFNGQFKSSNGEILAIEDRRVDHFHLNNTEWNKTFIGIARTHNQSPAELDIFAPDISPFIGTEMTIDESSGTIAVNWSDFRPDSKSRATIYKKIGSGEQDAAPNR